MYPRPNDILFLQDFLITPLYVIAIYLFAYSWRDRYYKRSEIRKYFIPALTVRIIGNFLAALMYQYYYHGGDTFQYFRGVTAFWHGFFYDPGVAYELLFVNPIDYSFDARLFAYAYIYAPSTGIVIKIGGLLSLLTFNTYLPTAQLITFLTFAGCWRLYKTFYEIYPELKKELAIAILFIPSVFFFGTGLQKDSIALAALGFLTYATYSVFIKRKTNIYHLLTLIISAYILLKVKAYILLGFGPALIIWIFWKYRSSIPNRSLRILVGPAFVLIIALGGYYVLQLIGNLYSVLALDYVIEYALIRQYDIARITEEVGGAGYSLGEIDPTPGGLIRVFPKAVIVSLFRPFPWEISTAITIPAAFEGFTTLIITGYVIFKTGIARILRLLIGNPEVAFALTFAIIFAFAMGFSTYNFGSLIRYKIPCLPFYYSALAIIWYHRSR